MTKWSSNTREDGQFHSKQANPSINTLSIKHIICAKHFKPSSGLDDHLHG